MTRNIALAAAGIALLAATPAAADMLAVSGDTMDVIVDTGTCDGSALTWCSQTGSSGPAAVGNNAIALVYVHVQRPNGNPITGLTSSDFRLQSVTNGGGVTPQIVASGTCGACFSEPEPGVYRFAVRPSSGNWGAGGYVTLLDVSIPSGATRQAMLPFDVQ